MDDIAKNREPQGDIRHIIRDAIADHDHCAMPCTCLRLNNPPSCAALADTIVEKLKNCGYEIKPES